MGHMAEKTKGDQFMSLFNFGLCLVCTLALSIGQILFKLAARQLEEQSLAGAFMANAWKNVYLLSAIVLYGMATLLWVWVLRRVPLNVAYPFTALAFVVVPMASFFLLDEPLSARLILGSFLIVAGICIAGDLKW